MNKKLITIVTIVVSIVIVAGAGIAAFASNRHARVVAESSSSVTKVKVSDTNLTLKNGKADLKVTLPAGVSGKLTGEDNVIDEINWPSATKTQTFKVTLTQNGTYYLDTNDNGKTARITILVGDGKAKSSSSSEASSASEEVAVASDESTVTYAEASSSYYVYTPEVTSPAASETTTSQVEPSAPSEPSVEPSTPSDETPSTPPAGE
jgi:hypothetical protein